MRLRAAASTILLATLAVVVASGQRQAQRPPQQPSGTPWHEVQSKEVNLRLRLPAQWQSKPATSNGRPCLAAISPKSTIYLHACSFHNADLSLDDLLDQTLTDLGIDLDDDPGEERINGLDTLVGEATTTLAGQDVGMFIVAAAYGDTRYVVTVMTRASLFDANARTMNRIVDSLAPLAAAAK